jgi:hypothetical protein
MQQAIRRHGPLYRQNEKQRRVVGNRWPNDVAVMFETHLMAISLPLAESRANSGPRKWLAVAKETGAVCRSSFILGEEGEAASMALTRYSK